ncbi:hypothetical protein [Glycomyces rhizosphaerae]|uniref:Lipoprotein n=1 Tax=Glycomyces rhizosphaerae TaxID=2054422 RepID=A0ABV7Q090_9ACTN
MTDRNTPAGQKPVRWPVYVTISVLLVVAGCAGAYRWISYDLGERPPELTSEYESSEALLVSEDLAGQLIAGLPVGGDGTPAFESRLWNTETCLSGWDDHLVWDGFVSVMVSYGLDIREDNRAQRIEYVQVIADELEEMGLEPTQEQHGEGSTSVHVDRDDGLSIRFTSEGGLTISTDCVAHGGEPVYTTPHVRISPANDDQDLERWPQSD